MQAQGLTDFLMRMLRFHPEQRATAGDLLSDPWLTAALPTPPRELVELSRRKRARDSAAAAPTPTPPPAAGPAAATPPPAADAFPSPLLPLVRSQSAQAYLSGGDDAARVGAAKGYSAVFCEDLRRYAITLGDFEALEARDLADAEAELTSAAYEGGAYLEHHVRPFSCAPLATLQSGVAVQCAVPFGSRACARGVRLPAGS